MKELQTLRERPFRRLFIQYPGSVAAQKVTKRLFTSATVCALFFFHKGGLCPLVIPRKAASFLAFFRDSKKEKGVRKGDGVPFSGRKKIAHGIIRIKALTFFARNAETGVCRQTDPPPAAGLARPTETLPRADRAGRRENIPPLTNRAD